MYCKSCGSQLEENAKFCGECGAEVETTLDEEAETQKEEKHSEKKVVKSKKKTKRVKEKKKQPAKKKDSEEKTAKSKRWVIFVILGVIICGTIGYFGYQYMELKKPIDSVWGQKYYVYLKEMNEKEKQEEAGLPTDTDDLKFSFHEVDGISDPIMVMTYEKEGDTYSNVYYIEDDKVNVLVYRDKMVVEFLYNIEKKEYDYYAHTKEGETDTYRLLEQEIKKDSSNDSTYTFTEEDKETVTDEDGKELSITKYEETFIDPNMKQRETNFSTDLEEKEIKEAVKKGIDKYQTQEELVTKKVENKVAKQEKKVQEQQEKIKKVQEENKKMTITTSNLQATIGEHLKWFEASYLGVLYGWPNIYHYKQVDIKLPNMPYDDWMVYELEGLDSVQSLKDNLAKYVDEKQFSKLKLDKLTDTSNGDGLIEYNGKVYWANGGIGCGPYFKDNEATLISSEKGMTKVLLKVYDCLSEQVEQEITVTIEYQKESGTYLITNWTSVEV